MEQRREFVRLAEQPGANRRGLCRRFGISAPTASIGVGRDRAGDRRCRPRYLTALPRRGGIQPRSLICPMNLATSKRCWRTMDIFQREQC
jgi:hypothetical protein